MAANLEAAFLDHAKALKRQGILDTSQFGQLQMLQDDNPNFVREILGLYFDNSENLLDEVSNALGQQNVDFKIAGDTVHQLKGTSSNVGAQRVQKFCDDFKVSCEQKSREGCFNCLVDLHHEYLLVKMELQYLLQMEQAILNTGGKVPRVDFD